MGKINPIPKKLLIDALRSGKYKQTFDKLRKGDCFCVEGVICDLYLKEHPNSRLAWGKSFWDDVIVNKRLDTELESLVMPLPILKWFYRDKKYVKFRLPGRGDYYLQHINDVLKLSFKEIADILEG